MSDPDDDEADLLALRSLYGVKAEGPEDQYIHTYIQ